MSINHTWSKKKKTNIMVDKKVWKKFKIYCLLKKKNVSKSLMTLIRKHLKENKEE